MFEELYEKLPDHEAYWKRLGIDPPTGPLGKDELDRIVFAHQCAIPFENLDACDKRAPSLGTRDLFEKIILGRRGGYCFELNALFTKLLAETGFEVYPVFARSLADRGYVYPVQHRGLIALVDGRKLFCDVGYGGPMPACGVPLEDGAEIASCGQVFSVERREGAWWHLFYRGSSQEAEDARAGKIEARKVPVLTFIDTPQIEADFLALSYFSSTHPDSVFTQKHMVNRRTADGSLSINADKFTRTAPSGKEVVSIESDEQLKGILLREFGIAYR